MNKKGIVPVIGITITTGILIVAAVILLLLLGGLFGLLFFIKTYALALVGIFLLVMALIGGLKKWNSKLIIVLLILGVLLVLISSLGYQNTILGKGATQYIYDNGEVVSGSVESFGLYNLLPSAKQNIWNIEKDIYTPGETIKTSVGITTIGLGTTVSKDIEYYKICYKGLSSKCYDFTTLIKSASNPLSVNFQLTAPSTTGSYVLYDIWKQIGKTEISSLGVQDHTFVIQSVITTCPNGACNNPQITNYYDINGERGYCEKKECWSFSSPPTCSKQINYKYKMSCPTGSFIEGKETNVESWQTSGCSRCVNPPASTIPEPINTTLPTGCISDVILTCENNQSITTQSCSSGVLVNTGNQCVPLTNSNSTTETYTPTTIENNKGILLWIILIPSIIIVGLIIFKLKQRKK